MNKLGKLYVIRRYVPIMQANSPVNSRIRQDDKYAMKDALFGFYATRIYLPCSAGIVRSWRRLSRRTRRKSPTFLQDVALPKVHWTNCVDRSLPRISEMRKANGNVRISELAIISALAATCRQGSSIFEIGTFDGKTTLNLALNAPKTCRIFTLDLPPNLNTKFRIAPGERHMIDKPTSGLRYKKYATKYPEKIEQIQQLLGDSAEYDYAPYQGTCSLVFVAGSHAHDYAISDSRVAMMLADPAGVVIWHDYGIWDGVTKALNELESKEKLGMCNIRGTSLVIWKKPI